MLKSQPLTLILLAIIAFLGLLVYLAYENPDAPATSFSLQSPSLVEPVSAHGVLPSTDIHERIKGEAGISAYCKSESQIRLDKVAQHFNTIEVQTDAYLLGSVSVPNYPELYDPHVYVRQDGWVMAYYFRHEPISKIVDVMTMDVHHTKLGNIAAQVLVWGDARPAEVGYYHFQYPQATNMMFVAESFDGGDNEFFVQIPSEFLYYEYSWALMNVTNDKYFKVNGVDQVTTPEILDKDRVWRGTTGYGRIRVDDLSRDKMHSIKVDEFGVLVLLYSVPE